MRYAALLGVAILATPLMGAHALASTILRIDGNAPALISHNSQGYLGVGLREVTEDQVNSFHVPPSRGLEIVVIDHDAPAAKAGLREHDILLRANGEVLDNVEKFRRMVRDTPPGHLLALIVSRDGTELTVPVKVANRAEVEKLAWSQHVAVIPESGMDMSTALPQKFGRTVPGSGFFATITPNSYYTGIIVDALGPQLASFFGAQTGYGLLVKSVDADSPASKAGIRAGDVIIKVGQTQMATSNDFYRAVRQNKSKQVSVTLLRDKKEQSVVLSVGQGKRDKSRVELPTLPQIVEIDPLKEHAGEVNQAELEIEIEQAITRVRAQSGPSIAELLPGLPDQLSFDEIGAAVEDSMHRLSPEIQQELQQTEKKLREMEPQLRAEAQQLAEISPQLEQQMRRQMDRYKAVEPQFREQLRQFEQSRPTPLI